MSTAPDQEDPRPNRIFTAPSVEHGLCWLLLALSAGLIYGCASAPRYRRGALPEPVKSGGRYIETGVASYYADKYHGRPTASGEIYDMNGISAAHPSLPLGTVVKVTNLENGRSVTVPINDRGPFKKKRIIDLSLGAARVIGMVDKGTARVRVEVIEWGREE